jgi:hypothetical protein
VAGDEDDGALQHGEATRRVRRLESEEGRPWVKLHRRVAVDGDAWVKSDAEGGSPATKLRQAGTGGGGKPCV